MRDAISLFLHLIPGIHPHETAENITPLATPPHQSCHPHASPPRALPTHYVAIHACRCGRLRRSLSVTGVRVARAAERRETLSSRRRRARLTARPAPSGARPRGACFRRPAAALAAPSPASGAGSCRVGEGGAPLSAAGPAEVFVTPALGATSPIGPLPSRAYRRLI